MSDFITLADLQALSDKELYKRWEWGKFPFEMVKSCGNCVTMHRPVQTFEGCTMHPEFVAAAGFIPDYHQLTAEFLRSKLEGIYALRLFFRDLYRDNPPELDDLNVSGTVTGHLTPSEPALQNVAFIVEVRG